MKMALRNTLARILEAITPKTATVNGCVFTKQGKLVTVSIPAQTSYLNAYETVTLCHIPSGFLPAYYVSGLIPTEDRTVNMRLIVNSGNGALQLYNPGGIITTCYRLATTFSYVGGVAHRLLKALQSLSFKGVMA